MKYLSVCSGIEAASQAFAPRGWKSVAFSEIEPFPCAVLAHHYPETPNWGDMTKFKDWPDANVDVLCGGTPCQSFSVAGLRQGLADPRGNLMLTFGAIADRYRPKWLVWENVPGVLSSNGGRDFGTFLGMLGQLGYGVAYRVLDAQHVRTRRFPHAVPQRRRRVFVIGYLGDWRRAAAVLFDRESLSGHPAPRRQAGKSTARGFECGPQGGSLTDLAPTLDTRCKDGPIRNQLGAGVMVSNSGDVGYCLTASAQGSLDAETETVVAQPISFGAQNAAAQGDGVAVGFVGALDKSKTPAVAFSAIDNGRDASEGVSPTMRKGGDGGQGQALAIATPWAVRRLTPEECEALQGFPRGVTKIPYRGKPAEKCPDGPRYKGIGNSWAVNCADYLAERIEIVDAWPNPILHNAGSSRPCADATPAHAGVFDTSRAALGVRALHEQTGGRIE